MGPVSKGPHDTAMPSGRALFGAEKVRSDGKQVPSGNKAILESVEKALLETLGGSAQAATLYFLEMKEGVKLSLLSGDPAGFVEALRAIFGAGSVELMKAILKELRLNEVKLGPDRLVHEFADVVERALRRVGAGAT
jgi:hypothetical protein